jgi:hypothetical protein
MSIFNTAVPPHPLSSLLLRPINWAQPDVYIKVLPPKEAPKKFHLIVSTSLRGMGSVSLTLKNVPDELHQRILNKYGDYQEMYDAGHVDEYEEFLGCEDINPVQTFYEENK